MLLTAGDYQLLRERLADDLAIVLPEILLVGGLLSGLFLKLFRVSQRMHGGIVALPFLFAALGVLIQQWSDGMASSVGRSAFAGLLLIDAMAGILRGLLLLYSILAILFSLATRLPDRDDSADFLTLLLGATLGMMIMASANHLLAMIIGLEMASLPSYALAGFSKGKKSGSEAALKYVLFGSAASAIAVYGMSLVVAGFGTASFPGIAQGVAGMLESGHAIGLAVAGLILVLVALGFKLSAVPLHFWCPDVFAGATAEIGAFLSIASKAAAAGLTLRFTLALHAGATQTHSSGLSSSLGIGIACVAALTMTLGNLAALTQSNLKRLLAYSTIAHAGYMLMAVATLNPSGQSALLYYLLAYVPTNLSAFAVVALVRNQTGAETLGAIRGLMTRSPMLAIALTASMLSLLGLPPLAGFAGKFQVFAAVYDAGSHLTWLLALGVLNTVLSAGFYLKVLRAIVLDDPEMEWQPEVSWLGRAFLLLLTVAMVALGIFWNPVLSLTERVAP